MRLANTLFALICMTATTAASADSFDTLQPAVYFEMKFGGQQRGLTAPSLDARLQYAGQAQSLLPASAAPAVLGWHLNTEGTVVSLSGVPLYARSWQLNYEGSDGSSRASKIVATSVSLTAVGVGVVLAAVGALAKALGEGTAQAMGDAFSGGQNSGSNDSGNTGTVCVGSLCPTGG